MRHTRWLARYGLELIAYYEETNRKKAMPLRTPQEWLELIDDALAKLIAGGVSSYSIAGRSFTKTDLRALEDLRQYWEQRVVESKRGFFTHADFSKWGDDNRL